MARKGLENFYNSSQWRKCRSYIVSKYNGICQDCIKDGVLSYGVDVHHIKTITKKDYLEGNWELLTGEDNLTLLCKEHHDKRHGKLSAVPEGYYFDEFGQLKPK